MNDREDSGINDSGGKLLVVQGGHSLPLLLFCKTNDLEKLHRCLSESRHDMEKA